MAAEHVARLGANIRRYRDAAGLNQRELAELLPGKTDGTQVSKWERGVNKPSDDTLERIAEIVGCTVADLYAREPEAGTADLIGALSPGEPSQLDRIERKLDDLLNRLPSDVAELLQTLAGVVPPGEHNESGRPSAPRGPGRRRRAS